MFVLGSRVSQEVWWPGAQGEFRSLRCAPLTVRTTFDELVVGLGVGALEGGMWHLRIERTDEFVEQPPGEASRNCGSIATLSRFFNSATLRGGLLGRMTNAFDEMGGL
jgi:hypothetical protein